MRPLDAKTLRRLAEIIVDVDGPFERSGRDLEDLLRNARWADPPGYDGSARVPWLVDVLTERSPEDVERLMCRICLPVEYEDGAVSADPVRAAVNEILAFERLTVADVAGRPLVTEIRESDGSPVYSAPDDLRPRLPRLLRDDSTIEALIARANEAVVSERSGAYSLALIGIGSFLEGLLYAVLHEHDREFAERGLRTKPGGWTRADRAGLAQLIDAVHQRGWIHLDAMDFAGHVREYRNFVHLRSQMEHAFTPDGDTVMLCWAPIRAVLNDLDAVLRGDP